METVEELTANLSSPKKSTRVSSARDLGEWRDERAVEPLIGLLGDTEPNVRRAGAEALAKIGGVRAIEALQGALHDASPSVARVARQSASALPTAGLLASTWRRLFNYVVDQVVVTVLLAALLRGEHTILWSLLVVFLYYFVTEALFHRSPAKLLTGTRVVTQDNQDPTVGQIALRTLIRFVPFDPVSLRAGTWWHDRWSKTRVIRV